MPKITPRKIEDKIRKTLNAWEELAPAKVFGGMTFTQFREVVAPSLEARVHIDGLQNQTTQAINQRDDADDVSLGKIQLVVNGVLADSTEGPNSSVYEAMGYTRKSERESGLTRKAGAGGSNPPKP